MNDIRNLQYMQVKENILFPALYLAMSLQVNRFRIIVLSSSCIYSIIWSQVNAFRKLLSILISSIRTSSLAWALFCGKHSPSFPKYKWTLSAFRFHYKKTVYIHIPISWDILTSEWYPQYLYRIFLNYAAFSGASEWISQKLCYFFLSKLNKLMCSWLFCVFCSLSFLKVQVNAFRKLVLLDTHCDLRV